MNEQNPQIQGPTLEEPFKVRPLTRMGFLLYVLQGIGVALGLCLFWGLEVVRNIFFRLLDRMNIKPRVRKASAFPPGQPRKRQLTEASR